MDAAAVGDEVVAGSEGPWFTVPRPKRTFFSNAITTLPHGRAPARSLRPLRGRVALVFTLLAAIGLVAVLTFMAFEVPWVGLIVAAVLTYVGVIAASGLRETAEDLLGQAAAAILLRSSTCWSGFLVGIAAGLVIGLWNVPDLAGYARRAIALYDDTLPVVVPVFLFVLAMVRLLMTLPRLPGAVERARADQVRIATLRSRGERFAGVLTVDAKCYAWRHSDPQMGGFVTIERTDYPRRITVGMRTSYDRVPINGTPVIVYTLGGDYHVDVHPTQPLEFVHESIFCPPEG